MASAGLGQAQQTSRPPPVDPQQTEKNLDALQVEQRRANRPALQMPRVARPQIQAGTLPLFQLTSVSVEGASAIPDDVIAETYRSYIGRTVSQSDLVTIAGKISDLYREAGYHLSRAIIPPQDVKGGRLRIQVIEGTIAEIVLTGQGAEQFGVRPLLAAVVDEHPSRLKTLERQLLLINDLPGVRIADTALEEIGLATGSFRLIVNLETWRIYTALGLDNSGTFAVGPLQAYSTTAFNSYFISGDTLGLNLATVPDATHELQFGRLSYDVPIGRDGARVGATALYSEVWPGDDRRILNTRIQNETYELRGSIVPLETRKSSLWLTAAAGFSDVSEKDSLGTNYSDHIRTVSLTADYKLQDNLDGWNYLTVILRQGINALGASQTGDALLSRDGASGNFSVLDFSYSRYQKLSDIWSVKASVAGQFASTPLLTSQAFYLGGTAFGPGYYSGDNGVAGSVELRFDQKLKYEFVKGYQLYGFIDGGQVWNIHGEKDSLSSIGAGVRFHLAGQLHASVAIAAPLSYTSRTNEFRDSRILFSLSNSFKLCPDRAQMRCF